MDTWLSNLAVRLSLGWQPPEFRVVLQLLAFCHNVAVAF